MIDVKQAVQSAEAYARELYQEDELRHFRLEEVERSDDGRGWNVTLGWVEPAVSKNALVLGGGLQKLPRIYKVFEVDGETGVVQSMRIRDVE